MYLTCEKMSKSLDNFLPTKKSIIIDYYKIKMEDLLFEVHISQKTIK